MRKKIAIFTAIVIVVLAGIFAYLDYKSRSLSPKESVSLTVGDLTVSITYGRPSARGRKIFGTPQENPLQPYGKYWRLGANEATEITFNRDILFNDSLIQAGSYRMYTFPGPDSFEIGLNKKLGEWGFDEPDYTQDVLRTKVPSENTSSLVEQLTITFSPNEKGINGIVEWSDTRFVIPIKTP